jgi:hypothetical protein
VGTDRSASQIGNPGVMPGFFVERTDDAESACGPSLQMPASKKLVAIGATADIRTRHGLARNDASDPTETLASRSLSGAKVDPSAIVFALAKTFCRA